MLTPSRRFLLSPRFFALPALAVAVIAALAQGAGAPDRAEAKVGGVRKAACAPEVPSGATGRDPACRFAGTQEALRILR